MGLRRATAAGTVLLAVLTGCGRGDSGTAPNVTVNVGAQTIPLQPTQYCLDGTGQRYATTPPVIEAAPDAPITFTVPDDVARQGWSVQVFDQALEEKIGEVQVEEGSAVFNGITTSDVVPPAFYLVVVEDKGGACGGLAGAWPVGFIRAGGGTPSSGAPSSGAMPSG